jgi:hypothetical protein
MTCGEFLIDSFLTTKFIIHFWSVEKLQQSLMVTHSSNKKQNNSKNIGDSSSNISQSAEKGLWQLSVEARSMCS